MLPPDYELGGQDSNGARLLNPTLFCAPIGHRQERGDYQESWQPCAMDKSQLEEAQDMARKVTQALGGAGIWGIEFFLGQNQIHE